MNYIYIFKFGEAKTSGQSDGEFFFKGWWYESMKIGNAFTLRKFQN